MHTDFYFVKTKLNTD